MHGLDPGAILGLFRAHVARRVAESCYHDLFTDSDGLYVVCRKSLSYMYAKVWMGLAQFPLVVHVCKGSIKARPGISSMRPWINVAWYGRGKFEGCFMFRKASSGAGEARHGAGVRVAYRREAQQLQHSIMARHSGFACAFWKRATLPV